MIKNIVFDMGGVMFDFNPVVFAERLNISEEDRKIIREEIYFSYNWALLDNGYYKDVEAFFEDVKHNIPERLWDIALEAAKYWWKPGIITIEGTADLIKKLKDKGYNIYLLSNAGPNHNEYWQYMKGHEYFDGLYVSAYAKIVKPNVEIFKDFLKKFNLNADETIFTDDLPTNCAGAFLAGIHPIVFRSAKQLEEKLVAMKVLQ